MADLHAVMEDLRPPDTLPVPNLGPIVAGGKSVLLQDCTHVTSGVGYPAFDDGWVAGKKVVAPEPLVVTRQSSAQGADAFYATGDSKIRYWVGHVVAAPANGRRFAKGETMGVIASLSKADGGPHVHLGIDTVPLTGFVLEHHTNYTHGAPLIGVQLREWAAD